MRVIIQAATLIADNHRKLVGAGTLPEAIKYFVENRPQKLPDITVCQVVDQLLALKEKEGEVGKIYLGTCGCVCTSSLNRSSALSVG